MRRRSRRSSGLADSSAHRRCCTLLLYGVKKATREDRKWPVTWVVRVLVSDLGLSVRQRPWVYAGVCGDRHSVGHSAQLPGPTLACP